MSVSGRERLVQILLAIGIAISGTYAAFVPLLIAASYFESMFLYVLLAYFGVTIGAASHFITKYVDPIDGAFWQGLPFKTQVMRHYWCIYRRISRTWKCILELIADIKARFKNKGGYPFHCWTGKHHVTGDFWLNTRVLNHLEFTYRKNVGWIFHWWKKGEYVERVPLIWMIKNEYAWPAPFTNWSQDQSLLMNRKPQ